ncbi:MAG: GNAT family N-acetyltransferase [Flavobacteriales bacterium]|nr:GNAT family N-acetyltransferase [Flavobacteriales bacterium]
MANLETVLRYFRPWRTRHGSRPERGMAIHAVACCWLLKADNQPVWSVCVGWMACEIKQLFVPVAHRRKGIAQALCVALLKSARNQGLQR